jgi:hypothetical protein
VNIEQANKILDQHKEGSHVYSMLTITRALFLTGDLPNEPPALGSDGEDPWGEELCMDTSEGIGC